MPWIPRILLSEDSVLLEGFRDPGTAQELKPLPVVLRGRQGMLCHQGHPQRLLRAVSRETGMWRVHV